MANEALKELFVQGLRALHTAGEQGSAAAAATAQAVTSPELKEQVEAGSQLAQRQADRVKQLFGMAGAEPSGMPNEISEGIQAANRKIMESANDNETRDAGIIASGQIAMHYQIAAFGTLGAYAKVLGMGEAAALLHQMTEDAKGQDERYTQVAETVINPRATAA